MKRLQPYFYIVALAGMFILAGLILFSIQMLPRAETTGVAVDPQAQDQDGALYDLWFTSTAIYDLNVDHGLTGILFSTDKNTVSLLDRDRKLRWDRSFSTAPRQAKISSCGNYIAVGTEGGRLFLTSDDQQLWWDAEGDPLKLVAFSPNANWVVAVRSQPDHELDQLELYSRDGEMKWAVENGPIENIYMSSEYLEQAGIFFTHRVDDQPVVTAVNLEGEKIWSLEGKSLAAVSRHGSRLAAIEGNNLVVYDSLGYELWSSSLPMEISRVLFNPQNYNRILVYGSREGGGENLFYFDLAEDLLWMARIADGSLFSFTADGQHVVTSSWRHYKEDYTQMVLLDRNGAELTSWEVAMRVERLSVSGHPHLVVVCGEDGYIDLIDIKPMIADNGNNDIPTIAIYNPVTAGLRADESRVTLYFVDENANLVPVSRAVSLTESPLRIAIEELIRGPARGSALYRTIPDKDIYIDVDFSPETGRLKLDLSPELAQVSGAVQSNTALNSLLYTVSSFLEVKEIYLTVHNEPIEKFGEGLELEQPLEPQRWDNPVYIPTMSGNRYYLLIREGAEADIDDAPGIKDLVEQVLRAGRALPFVPSDLGLIELKSSPEQVQIVLNDSFKDLFPEEGEEQERLQSLLLLDALFMTVFENSRLQRVELLVEDESWSPPAGYPSLSRFYRQPYFINPEQ